MNRIYRNNDDGDDDDRDLPWDPMWAYVLGEDIDERDSRCDDEKRRQNDYLFGGGGNSSNNNNHNHRDESRDVSGTDGSTSIIPTGILKNLWKRKEKDTTGSSLFPSSSSSMLSSRPIPRKSRSVDREEWTWELDLMPTTSATTPKHDNNNKHESTWLSTKKSLDSSSWIGKHRSLSLRKHH